MNSPIPPDLVALEIRVEPRLHLFVIQGHSLPSRGFSVGLGDRRDRFD